MCEITTHTHTQTRTQERINSPEALAAAAAAAAAEAAAAANEGPLHEDNEWGIEVVGDAAGGSGAAAGSSGAGGQQALPEGVQFSMPAASGVDAATLRAEGVEATDASLDELTGMLAALGGSGGGGGGN